MREAAHSFPLQNRAAITSSSSLYDRRSIDNALPTLPLLNSLQSLAYLTSTSPRIREILTLDGGLERLISIVGGCIDVAFPHSVDPARKVAGRRSSHPKTPQSHTRRPIPFKPFSAYSSSNAANGYRHVDQHALLHTYGFALQCLVNVGVRGSEQIRTRVVEAGVLQIVARILSGFLATRQKERERRTAQVEPSRSITSWREDAAAATPRASSVQLVQPTPAQPSARPISASRLPHLPIQRTNTPDTIASIDEPEQEQIDADNENEAESSGQENENDEEKMDTEEESTVDSAASATTLSRGRRGTIIKMGSSSVISTVASHRGLGNDSDPTPTPRDASENGDMILDSATAADVTAQAAANISHSSTVDAIENAIQQDSVDSIMHPAISLHSPSANTSQNDLRHSTAGQSGAAPSNSPSSSTALFAPLQDYHYKEDDVLHCLQLLAYLSKYPHVRAVFHDPENESARPPPPSTPITSSTSSNGSPRKKQRCGENGESCCTSSSSDGPSTSSHACCHDYDDEISGEGSHHAHDGDSEELAQARALASIPAKDRKPALEPSRPPRSTANNVFSLVEQFTFRASSSTERSMRLPTEIQYWSGVIMRNACRKDEARGGIRQCANMGCGIWERFPREFAKCRRCRKAKYCSKSCQRKAWQSGHRYWCSARQDSPPHNHGNAGSGERAERSANDENATGTPQEPQLPTVAGTTTPVAQNLAGQETVHRNEGGRTRRGAAAAVEEDDDEDMLHDPSTHRPAGRHHHQHEQREDRFEMVAIAGTQLDDEEDDEMQGPGGRGNRVHLPNHALGEPGVGGNGGVLLE